MPPELQRMVRLTSFPKKSGRGQRSATGCRGLLESASRPSNTYGDGSMELAPDFDEFIGSLTAHGVEFVVGGAYTLAFHGAWSARPASSLEWVVALAAALFLTPCCEVARAVQVSDRDHFFGRTL